MYFINLTRTHILKKCELFVHSRRCRTSSQCPVTITGCTEIVKVTKQDEVEGQNCVFLQSYSLVLVQ